MIDDSLKEEIRGRWREIMPHITSPAKTRVNGEVSWICPCPNCNHGKGGDGLTFIPDNPNILKCHACGFSGDIYALLAEVYELDIRRDFPAILEKAAGFLGISVSEPVKKNPPPVKKDPEVKKDPPPDFTSYLKTCRDRIRTPEGAPGLRYITQVRGIPEAVALDVFQCGYDPACTAPPLYALNGKHPYPALIIPNSSGGYTARNVGPAIIDEKGNVKRYGIPKGGGQGLTVQAAELLEGTAPVFITEGAIDAMSVTAAGGPAIGLNSAADYKMFAASLKEHPPLVIFLDNDATGEKAAAALTEALEGVTIRATLPEGVHDPGDFWTQNPEGMKAAIASYQAEAKKAAAHAIRPDGIADYIRDAMGADLRTFRKKAAWGFPDLDKKSNGVYAGLCIIAASTSLGKTDFCLQVADNIAESGHDVLYFSLEMSRLELVTRSIARRSAELNPFHGMDALTIRAGGWSDTVEKAADLHAEKVGNRLSVVEGSFSTSILDVVLYTRDYIQRTGERPAIFIDYLQPLKPAPLDDQGGLLPLTAIMDGKAAVPGNLKPRTLSDKQAIDENMSALKIMSRRWGLPVIAISSLNRANYMLPVDFESLKESGSIEYSADVVFGLNYRIIKDDEAFAKEKNITEKREKISKAMNGDTITGARKIWMNNLKNRFGRARFDCYFTYTPRVSTYREDTTGIFVPDEEAEDLKRAEAIFTPEVTG